MADIDIAINFDYLRDNYLFFRELTGQGDDCIPVVKANAYGLGLLEVVGALLDLENPPRDFFVYSLGEACRIRSNFGDLVRNIYVLRGLVAGQEEIFLEYNATPVVNGLEQLELWSNYAKGGGMKLNTVLQFNVGINRSGIEIDLAQCVGDFMANHKNEINLTMLMGHVACQYPLDSLLGQKYTSGELANFKKIAFLFPGIKRSLAETRCALYIPDSLYDCSRIGIGLFTFEKEKNTKIKTVLTIKCVLKYDEPSGETYMNFGEENGLVRDYEKNGFVYIEGEKILIRRLEKRRVILNFDARWRNSGPKTALLVGQQGKDQIDGFEFSRMNGTIPEEFFATIITMNEKNRAVKINRIGGKFSGKNQIEIGNYIRHGLEDNFVKFDPDGRLTKLISIVSEKRIVNEDGFCGYDATESVKRGDPLITVPIGYLGGFSRKFNGEKIEMFVEGRGGKLFPCILCGKVSMDQICARIDREYFNEIKIGDRVIVVDSSRGIGNKLSFLLNIPLLLARAGN
ncbi:MAG: alanine racemase [Rickettsiales bacterium]|jgi:alanine racemase|nr:alanine racemase [Rickettsiales bacterium]